MDLQQLDTFSAKIIDQNYNHRNVEVFKSRDFYQANKQLKIQHYNFHESGESEPEFLNFLGA